MHHTLPHNLIEKNVARATSGQLVGFVKKFVTTHHEIPTIQYVYVLDVHEHLIGVVSIKELCRADENAIINEVMNKNVITANIHSHKNHITHLALKHKLKAIPITNKDDIFLGAITADTLFELLDQEHSHALMKAVGIHIPREYTQGVMMGNTIHNILKRIPWLILGVVGGFGAAVVINIFEGVINSKILLAAFIPTIAYIADSVGSQTQTLYIRSLSLQNNLSCTKYIIKELGVVLGIGITLGVLAILGVTFFYNDPIVAFILGTSIIITSIIAAVIALLLPTIFKHFKVDPAVASGPFATIIRDISSLLIYFMIAEQFINFLK